MKKLILMGRSGCGKTTLMQALKGKKIEYNKTQSIDYHDFLIDTPGEYAENHILGRALALYTYEADIVGLLCSATEAYCLFPPCVTSQCNREVVGIVTKIDRSDANPKRAENWLRLAGCKKIFMVSSYQNKGISDILEYISQQKQQNQK